MNTDEGTKSGRFSEWDAREVFGMNFVDLNSLAKTWRSLRESNPSFQIENRTKSELLPCVSQLGDTNSAQMNSIGYGGTGKRHRVPILPPPKRSAIAA